MTETDERMPPMGLDPKAYRQDWTAPPDVDADAHRIPRLLRHWRRLRGNTIDFVRARTGIADAEALEAGSRHPTEAELQAWAEACRAPSAALYGRHCAEPDTRPWVDARGADAPPVDEHHRRLLDDMHHRMTMLHSELESDGILTLRGTLAELDPEEPETAGAALAWLLQPEGPGREPPRDHELWVRQLRYLAGKAGVPVLLLPAEPYGADRVDDWTATAAWTHMIWRYPNLVTVGVRDPLPASAGPGGDRLTTAGVILDALLTLAGDGTTKRDARLLSAADRNRRNPASAAMRTMAELGLGPDPADAAAWAATYPPEPLPVPPETTPHRHLLGDSFVALGQYIDHGGTNMRMAANVLGCGRAELRDL